MSTKDKGSVQGFTTGITYESPKVTMERLDNGGNYVSSASRPTDGVTLGNSPVI
jgi:hypothetical protein